MRAFIHLRFSLGCGVFGSMGLFCSIRLFSDNEPSRFVKAFDFAHAHKHVPLHFCRLYTKPKKGLKRRFCPRRRHEFKVLMLTKLASQKPLTRIPLWYTSL